MRKINLIIAILVILLNLYFIPLTINILKTSGGAMGFGLLAFPFSLVVNSSLITTFLTFKSRFKESKMLMVINFLSVFLGTFLLYLLLSTPVLD